MCPACATLFYAFKDQTAPSASVSLTFRSNQEASWRLPLGSNLSGEDEHGRELLTRTSAAPPLPTNPLFDVGQEVGSFNKGISQLLKKTVSGGGSEGSASVQGLLVLEAACALFLLPAGERLVENANTVT